MNKRWIYHALVITVASVSLGILYFNIEITATSRYNQVVNGLQELKRQDAALNSEVFNIRAGLTKHYDSLVETNSGTELLIDSFRDGETSIVGKGNADIDQLVKQYRNLHVKRTILIERFKARNSTLKNALYYFPIAATEIVRQAQPDVMSPELVISVEQLLKHLLSYYINSSKTTYEKVKVGLKNMKNFLPTLPQEMRPSLFEMIMHASIALWHKREVDELLQQITSEEPAAVADSLFHVYQIGHQNAQKLAKIYRVVFYMGVSAVLCYFVFLIFGRARPGSRGGNSAGRQRTAFAQ